MATAALPPTSPISLRRQTAVVVLFALSAILGQLDRQAIAVLKPLMLGDLGWSDANYAAIIATSQFVAAFALLIAGVVVDRMHVRAAGVVTVFGWSLAVLGQAWMRTIAQASALRIGQGVFQAMAIPAGLRALSEFLPADRRAIGFAVSNAAVTIGGIVAPLILPAMAVMCGWRGTFAILGVLGLGWSLAWLQVSRLRTPSAAERSAAKAQQSRRFLGIIRNRRYQFIALGKTLSDLTWWVMLFWLPDFFHHQFHLSPLQAGPSLAVAYGLCALGALGFGMTINRFIARGWSRARTYRAVLVLAFVCTLVIPAATQVAAPSTAALLVGVGLFGHQGFGTTIFAITADTSRPGEIGRVIGFSAFCGNVAGSIAVIAAGKVIAAGAGFAPIFFAAPVAYAFSLLVFLRLFGDDSNSHFRVFGNGSVEERQASANAVG